MTKVPEHVQRMCDEFGIVIVPKHKYPAPGQTRAVATIDRIWRKFGEGHLRMVLTTLVETANNKACLDEAALWATSDLVRACAGIIEHHPTEWLELWDVVPVGELQFVTQDLYGVTPLRHALSGMIYERIVRRFGPRFSQPDLFDDRRPK